MTPSCWRRRSRPAVERLVAALDDAAVRLVAAGAGEVVSRRRELARQRHAVHGALAAASAAGGGSVEQAARRLEQLGVRARAVARGKGVDHRIGRAVLADVERGASAATAAEHRRAVEEGVVGLDQRRLRVLSVGVSRERVERRKDGAVDVHAEDGPEAGAVVRHLGRAVEASVGGEEEPRVGERAVGDAAAEDVDHRVVVARRIDRERGPEAVGSVVPRDAIERRARNDEMPEGIAAVVGAVEVVDHREVVAGRVDLEDDARARVAAVLTGAVEESVGRENDGGVRV